MTQPSASTLRLDAARPQGARPPTPVAASHRAPESTARRPRPPSRPRSARTPARPATTCASSPRSGSWRRPAKATGGNAGGGRRPRCTRWRSATWPTIRTAEAASDWLRRHYLRAFVERYEGWLDAHATWPLEWQDAAGASDYADPTSPRPAGRVQRRIRGARRALPASPRPTTPRRASRRRSTSTPSRSPAHVDDRPRRPLAPAAATSSWSRCAGCRPAC